MSLPAAARPSRDVHILRDLAAPRWDAYVESHPEATGYHLYGWRHVIERAFGHETCYLAAYEDGHIAGLLPLVVFRSRLFGRFLVSMPFLNYGGVLADDEEVARVLVEAAVAEARRYGARWVELRHTRRLCPGLHAKEHKVAMRLRLEASPDAQWDALDRKVRNQVRKADKNGLTVVSGGRGLLGGFYDVFARNMRDLGTPVYGRGFFEEVLDVFPDRSRVFAVEHGGRVVAGAIVFRWRRTLEVPWASSLRAFNHLCANIRLYWEMIRHAVASGCWVFDFGRSTPDEGTFHFKKQWGAEPSPLVWEYWTADGVAVPDLSPKNARFRTAIAVWKRLPVPVTRMIGPAIVRNIP